MRAALLCVLVLFCTTVAQARDLEQLAQQPRWQALLHINPGATLRDRQRSYVDDADFFLAAEQKEGEEGHGGAGDNAIDAHEFKVMMSMPEARECRSLTS